MLLFFPVKNIFLSVKKIKRLSVKIKDCPWKKRKKCPWKIKYARENFRKLWIFKNFHGQNSKNPVSASETENYLPVKNSDTLPVKNCKCAWKYWKKCPWKQLCAREKNQENGQKWLSRTLLVFTGEINDPALDIVNEL